MILFAITHILIRSVIEDHNLTQENNKYFD